VSRWEHEVVLEAMEDRVDRMRNCMRIRAGTVLARDIGHMIGLTYAFVYEETWRAFHGCLKTFYSCSIRITIRREL